MSRPFSTSNAKAEIDGRMAALASGAYNVPIVPGADNSIAINAALANAANLVVQLPPGDITTNGAVVVPSGKWLRGAGKGVTRLVAASTIPNVPAIGKAVVISYNSTGVRVSDLTVVAPKTTGLVGDKVQGVWMRNAKHFLVESVEAFNCGYAFWAQEFSQYGEFRNITSHNANVHFETTRAFDILFDGMDADDGDGDNPLGYESTWHCLFGSKRITFRNGRHRGGGQPFLLVADSGTGDAGLIDEIRFENCRTVQTQAKIAFFISVMSGTIGRVDVVDCDVDGISGGGSIPMQIQAGRVYARGGFWRSAVQEVMMVGINATLEWENPNVYVSATPGASGYFFSKASRVYGGTLETATETIENAAGVGTWFSPTTRIIRPGNRGKIYGPTLGLPVVHVFPVDLQHTFTQPWGAPTPGGGTTQMLLSNGATYRVQFVGKLKKSASGGRFIAMRIDALGGTMLSGTAKLQTAPTTITTYQLASNGVLASYTGMDEASFDVEMLILGNGGQLSLSAWDGEPILAAGSTFRIERLN